MQPSYRRQLVQLIAVFIAHVIALFILSQTLSGFQADSPRSLIMLTIMIAVPQAVFWWVFVRFFSWLPGWLFPIATFVLNGAAIYFLGNQVIGITIETVGTAIWLSLWMTAVNAILSGVLGLDEDARFDRTVIKSMIERRGKPDKTDVPGFLFLEIDGLSEMLFHRALEEGHLPTLKPWIDQGTHEVLGWETDFSAQTGAMQSGIPLMDLAGLHDVSNRPPGVPIQGSSFKALLLGTNTAKARREFAGRIVVVDNQREDELIKYKEACIMRNDLNAAGDVIHQWRLMLPSKTKAPAPPELYDLQTDPHQQNNLAGDPEKSELVATLKAAYETWWQTASTHAADYARPLLGTKFQPEICLYSHDWHTSVIPPWSQAMIAEGRANNGFNAVSFGVAGDYTFDLCQ